MRNSFDRRVLPERLLDFIRRCQERVPCHLAGGAALAGAYLGHRTTGDVDLFFHDADEMRLLVLALSDVAAEAGLKSEILRDARSLVRASVRSAEAATELDLVHEPLEDVEPPPPPLEGIVVESLVDLRAAKLTCILSRSEPRDLVDLYFLDRAGHAPEKDLGAALRKDAGIDPGVLAWLLASFPTEPLPTMLLPLSSEELRRFRDELAERLRRTAIP
ncbi:MAG: nucleotidyl transferase AbiEii/AbiGii toxin family protein [Vicinamibacteria bacterium]